MKKEHVILIVVSILVGAFVGSELIPIAPVWKILALVLSPLLVIGIAYLFGSKLFGDSRMGSNSQMSNLHSLLEKLGNNDFDRDSPDYKILQKNSPELAHQLLKVHGVYQANHQFSQNAAHELQTPLAVIKAHAESLLQVPNLSEREAEAIGAILQNINRLSRLNSALILLSKIEPGRFPDDGLVDFCEITQTTLEHFSDMIEVQGLAVKTNFTAPFEMTMSNTLAEILIANLIQNAVRHNQPDGYVLVESDKNSFAISNPGSPLTGPSENLFKRFYRESHAEEGLGLGLSIVKRIVDQSGLSIIHDYKNGLHSFTVKSMK